MSFQTKFNYIIAKTEVTAGTAVALSGTDFDWCPIDGTIEYTPTIEIDDENAKCANAEHGESESITGNQFATVSFSYKYRWSGAVATAPKMNTKLFPACGLTETVIGATGVKWEPLLAGDSADGNSITIGVYEKERLASPQARLHTLAGCMGNAVFTCEGVGKPLIVSFTFTGKIISVTDVTAGSVPAIGTTDTALPEKYLSTTVSLHGSSLKTSVFSFDIGNDVQPVLNPADSRGIDYFEIASRVPRFSINPYTERVATFDTYSTIKDMTIAANTLTFGTNHFIVSMPNTQILTAAQASREGLNAEDLNFKLLRNGTDIATMEDESTFQLLQGATS